MEWNGSKLNKLKEFDRNEKEFKGIVLEWSKSKLTKRNQRKWMEMKENERNWK